MTVIATIDWFGRRGTSVFSENTAIFLDFKLCRCKNENLIIWGLRTKHRPQCYQCE